MGRVRRIRSDEWDRWDRFVEFHEMGSIYHTSLWREIIERSYGHRPSYIVIEGETGHIVAGLPFFMIGSKVTGARLTCLPCAQSADPLVSNQEDYDQIINYAKTFIKTKNIKVIEIKTSERFRENTMKFGQVLCDYSSFVLDLDRELGSIESSFHRSCIRRAIRKSNNNGLELVIGESVNDLKSFYRLYLMMRKTYGLMPQPFKFFKNMWEILSKDNCMNILNAKHNGQVISSIILIKSKDTMIYEYGASRHDMKQLGGSIFLLWEAIKQAKREGFRKFDFGRTPNQNRGLYTFKKRWGAKPETLPYYFIPNMGGVELMRQSASSQKLMHYIMVVSPYIFCRMMGRLSYRYLV